MAFSEKASHQVAVVLHQPRLSENIGTTARAAANMGLGPLVIVEPPELDMDIIYAAGTRGARDLIDRMAIFDDLGSALADYQLVVGTTARSGNHRGPFFSPRDLARQVAGQGKDIATALLFGTERSGLTNEDLRRCQVVVRIPTADPKSSSLNLAQAVLILGYELLLASVGSPSAPRIKPAHASEVQAMYHQWSDTLVKIGFLPDQNTGHWLMSFKRIFNRSGLTHGECNLLRGVCRQIEWAMRTGGKKGRT